MAKAQCGFENNIRIAAEFLNNLQCISGGCFILRATGVFFSFVRAQISLKNNRGFAAITFLNIVLRYGLSYEIFLVYC